jgi:hypothetical protein
VSGPLHAPTALLPGKEPPVLIGQEARWAPGAVWTLWRREKSWPCRESNPGHPVRLYTDWAIPTSLVSLQVLNNDTVLKQLSNFRNKLIHLYTECAHPQSSEINDDVPIYWNKGASIVFKIILETGVGFNCGINNDGYGPLMLSLAWIFAIQRYLMWKSFIVNNLYIHTYQVHIKIKNCWIHAWLWVLLSPGIN